MITNVQAEHERILKLISLHDFERNHSHQHEVKARLERIIHYLEHYLNKYSHVLTHAKIKIINTIGSHFHKMLSCGARNEFMKFDSMIQHEYINLNRLSPVYLVRHPEKSDPNHIGAVSNSGRELSFEGVRQAKIFSEGIIEEVLLSNRAVQINLRFSPYKRTKLFADVIERMVNHAVSAHGKVVRIIKEPDAMISGNLLKIPAGQGLEEWIKSENAHFTAKSIYNWFASGLTHGHEHYVITVGVTHLPVICAFLFYQLRVEPKRATNFRYADFIKLVEGKFYYEGKWH